MQILKNGIFCFIEDIKVDIIAHQYPLLNPVEVLKGIRLVSIDDIAAMKLHAIVQNGKRIKDYADIYVMLEHRSMEQFYSVYEEKYHPNASCQVAQKGILYHTEIDFDIPVQFLDREFNWSKIADRLKEGVALPQKKFFTIQRPARRVVRNKSGRGL